MQGRGQRVELHLGILHLWSWVLTFFYLWKLKGIGYSYCGNAESTRQTAHLYYWFRVTSVFLDDFSGTFSACLRGFMSRKMSGNFKIFLSWKVFITVPMPANGGSGHRKVGVYAAKPLSPSILLNLHLPGLPIPHTGNHATSWKNSALKEIRGLHYFFSPRLHWRC